MTGSNGRCPVDLFRQPEVTSSTLEVTVRDIIVNDSDVISLVAAVSDVISAGNDVMSFVATGSDVIDNGSDRT